MGVGFQNVNMCTCSHVRLVTSGRPYCQRSIKVCIHFQAGVVTHLGENIRHRPG